MEKIELNYFEGMVCRIVMSMAIIVLAWGCQKEELEKEIVDKTVENFLHIDEKLYDELRDDPIFVSVTQEYIIARDKMIENKGKEYQAWGKAKLRLDSLVKCFGCWNLFAYCLRYEEDHKLSSRAVHAWGKCQLYNGDVCNTYANWKMG